MKPTIEILESRNAPATGISHVVSGGWDVTQVEAWTDAAEAVRATAVVGAASVEGVSDHRFVELRAEAGKLWALNGVTTAAAETLDGTVFATITTTRDNPVLVVAADISGASITRTDVAYVVAFQSGSKVYTTSSADGLTWTAPTLVADLATANPTAGEVFGLAPLVADASLNAVVSTGPAVSWVTTDAVQYHLVTDVAWQDAGGVHAAEVEGGALHALDLDAAFAHPDLFLDLGHAYWGNA